MKKIIFVAMSFFSTAVLYAQSADCPTMVINSGNTEYNEGQSATIRADVKGKGDYTYNWSVSAGIISSGQGSSSITIDTKGQAGISITATVELGGVSRDCSSTASATISVVPAPKIKTKTTAKPAGVKAVKKTKSQKYKI